MPFKMLRVVIRPFTLQGCILLTAILFIDVCSMYLLYVPDCGFTYYRYRHALNCRKNNHSELNDLNRLPLVIRCDGADDVYEDCSSIPNFENFVIIYCALTDDTFNFCKHNISHKYRKPPGNHKNVALWNGTFRNLHTFLSENETLPAPFKCGILWLDISNSYIDGLPDNAFRCLQKLEVLDLSVNRISALPKCLRDLSLLEHLNLSDNLITVFPQTALHERARLKILSLSRNGIKSFCPAEISQLDVLEELYLRANNITSLTNGCFAKQKKLTKLDIGMNFGLVLENDSFVGLENLKKLYIDGCELSLRVGDSTVFSDTTLLETLHLQHNRLLEIHSDLFQNLSDLEYLDLSFNAISVLHDGCFAQNNKLLYLDLSNNRLTEIKSGEFPRMYRLDLLSISNNNISHVAENAFRDLRRLKRVNLSNNNISQRMEESSVPLNTFKKIFRNLKHLEILAMSNVTSKDFRLVFKKEHKTITYLDVSFNVGLRLERNSLINLKNLRTFISQSTNVESLEDLFENNAALEEINMSANKIQRIGTYDLWNNENLRILDLSWNNISEIYDHAFKFCGKIEYVNLSHNALQYMNIKRSFLGNKRLEVLDISSNRISRIPLGNFTLVETLWASNNTLVELILPEFMMTSCQVVHLEDCKIQKVHVHSNLEIKNLISNCRTQFFLAGNPMVCDCHAYQLHKFNKHPSSKNIFLFEGLTCRHPVELEGRKMESLLPNEFSCKVNRSCPATCLCLERVHDHTVTVNCSRRDLRSLPGDVPANTTILDVSYNHIASLESLNSSIWKNLTEIRAEGNSISSLEYEVPKNVRIFLLHENNLTKLPKNHTAVTRRDLQITLSENPWPCSCESMKLKHFLSKHGTQILDAFEVRCSLSNISRSNRTLLEMKEQDLCPQSEKVYLKESSKKSVYISLIAVLSVLVFGLSLWVFYIKNENFVKAVIYTHCTCFLKLPGCRKMVEEDKIFDCFISYGSEDVDVPLAIVEAMGEDPNPEFKFLVHDRHWPGGSTISDNIFLSVEFSRKTLIVVSRTFVKSRWFYLEFQAALLQMLQDRRDRMIFVIKGEMPDFEALPRDVRYFLRTRTYLVWGDRWFMQKLRYSLQEESVPFRVQLREFLLVVVNCFRIRRIYHRDLHEEIV